MITDLKEDLKDFLVTAGCGVFNSHSAGSWNISINVMPDSPAQSITILAQPGSLPPQQAYNSGIKPLRRDSASIRVRAGTDAACHSKMEAIMSALCRNSFSSAHCHYDGIIVTSPPFFLMKDTQERFIWALNLRCIRREI